MTTYRPPNGQRSLFPRGSSTRVARVRRSCDAAVTALRRTDRLDRDRPDLVAVARTLADAIDRQAVDVEGSDYTLARLTGEYSRVMGEAIGTAGQLDQFTFDEERFPGLRYPEVPAASTTED